MVDGIESLKENVLYTEIIDMNSENGVKDIDSPMSTLEIEKVLEDMNLSPITHQLKKPGSRDSTAAEGHRRRNKRKYIRQRLREGKPYIPATIRALGREGAASMGYTNWSHTPTGRTPDIELLKLIIEEIVGVALDSNNLVGISEDTMNRQKNILAASLGIKREGLEVFLGKLIDSKKEEQEETNRVEKSKEIMMPQIEQALKEVRASESANISSEPLSIIPKENLIYDQIKDDEEIVRENTIIENEQEWNNIPAADPLRQSIEIITGGIPYEELDKETKDIYDNRKSALLYLYDNLDEGLWGTEKAKKLFNNILKFGFKP